MRKEEQNRPKFKNWPTLVVTHSKGFPKLYYDNNSSEDESLELTLAHIGTYVWYYILTPHPVSPLTLIT
jgi:hypothetical protein